jgi:hypothetical protein
VGALMKRFCWSLVAAPTSASGNTSHPSRQPKHINKIKINTVCGFRGWQKKKEAGVTNALTFQK